MSLADKITSTDSDQRISGHAFDGTLKLWLQDIITGQQAQSRMASYYPTVTFGAEEQSDLLAIRATFDEIGASDKIAYDAIQNPTADDKADYALLLIESTAEKGKFIATVEPSMEDLESGLITAAQWENRMGIS